mmetsp:Transcript_1337/g.2920  ORF Transcript_1337/g.2920 Transcript_1337/m.2920 type:complete len:227 (-) Transcript_1337:612-1292(-)
MRRSRRSWSGACSDTARVLCRRAPANRSSDRGTPTVEMVMCRAPMPTSALSASCARRTLGMLSNGSPIPMNTTFVTRTPKCSSNDTTWSTISCGAKLRANPPFPVAQKVHRMGHPTCEETQAVRRFLPFSVAGMPTASTTRSSLKRNSNFAVPSAACATWCTVDRPISTLASRNASRITLGRVVRSSRVLAGLGPYRWSRSCFPRNPGSPLDTANCFSSPRVRPMR